MRVGPAASRGRRAPRRCARATLQCRGPGCTVVRHMPAVSGPLAATNRPTAFAHDSQFLGGSSDSLSERATRCEAAVHRLRQVPVVVVVRLQGPPTVVPPLKALKDILSPATHRSAIERPDDRHALCDVPSWIGRAARVHDAPLVVHREMAGRSDIYCATLPPTRSPEAALGHCLLKATTLEIPSFFHMKSIRRNPS